MFQWPSSLLSWSMVMVMIWKGSCYSCTAACWNSCKINWHCVFMLKTTPTLAELVISVYRPANWYMYACMHMYRYTIHYLSVDFSAIPNQQPPPPPLSPPPTPTPPVSLSRVTRNVLLQSNNSKGFFVVVVFVCFSFFKRAIVTACKAVSMPCCAV